MKKKLKLTKKTIASLTDSALIIGGNKRTVNDTCGCELTWDPRNTACQTAKGFECGGLTNDPIICDPNPTQGGNTCELPSHLDPNCTNNTLDC